MQTTIDSKLSFVYQIKQIETTKLYIKSNLRHPFCQHIGLYTDESFHSNKGDDSFENQEVMILIYSLVNL